MTAAQETLPGRRRRMFKFAQHGKSGAWVSELLPHTAKVADDLCFVKSLHTEAINHDPAITFFQTGRPARRPAEHRGVARLRPGQREPGPAGVRRPDLAGHAATRPTSRSTTGSGAAASCRRKYQGVKFRAQGDPVLYLVEPRRASTPRPAGSMLDDLAELNQLQARREPATRRSPTRIAQYEMAFRMQTSVPGADRPVEGAGGDVRAVRPGRRRRRARSPRTACWPGGWPSAACGSSSSSTAAGTSTRNLPKQIDGQCRDTDQRVGGAGHRPEAARPARRHARRLGRRVRPDGLLPGQADGRRLRPRPSPALLHHLDGRRRRQAGHHATARRTTSATTSSSDPVHVHDLHATILHCLGIDHTKLTFKFQGRDYRLTDVHGEVVKGVLA